ncbi:MAG: RNA polymerase sigma factor [Planctomycetaceae bacterium]
MALNVWRGRRKTPVSQPFDSSVPPAVEPELDRFIEEESLRHLAERALAVMRTDFQPAIWQACWETVVEGRSGQEVADKLGLSVAAVYSARSRVLRRLREELGDFLS